MSRFSIVGPLILISILFVQASGEAPSDKSKTVPLNKIWAYEMPGTRDVRELEPQLDVHDPKFAENWKQSLVRQMASFLSTHVPDEGDTAGPAFIVVGSGKGALTNALATLTDRERRKRERPYPKDWELSLVFFSYVTGWHPQIKSVEQSPNSINVKYQFVAVEEPSLAAVRFALIPIGKLPKGTVSVTIEQLPPVDFRGRAMPPKKNAKRFVCDSFSFDVR